VHHFLILSGLRDPGTAFFRVRLLPAHLTSEGNQRFFQVVLKTDRPVGLFCESLGIFMARK
jgi:hypothetical protein